MFFVNARGSASAVVYENITTVNVRQTEREEEQARKGQRERERVSATLSLFGWRNVEEVKNTAAINDESLILSLSTFFMFFNNCKKYN